MKAEEDDFRKHFAGLSDEELLSLDYEALTDLARRRYDDEIKLRNLHRSLESVEIQDEIDIPMYSVRVFSFLSEAAAARGLLQSAEIPCYIENENALRMVWAWNICLGGFRLMVPTSMATEADDMLATTWGEEELKWAETDAETGTPEGRAWDFPFRGVIGNRTMAIIVLLFAMGPDVDHSQLIYVWR